MTTEPRGEANGSMNGAGEGDQAATPSAEVALRRLLLGNDRFCRGATRFAGIPQEVLASLVKGQRPYATILGCSDSRVPPEAVFDALPGELFVIRVAGNVMSPEVAGSLQYAGAHLKTPLCMVLGHEGCGAVEAALQTRLEGVTHRSRIQLLVDSILPALDAVDLSLPAEARSAAAVEANVRWSLRQIRETPEARARLAEGSVMLVGAVYDLRSARVRLLADPSGQD
jgi:carbonic anhydrase